MQGIYIITNKINNQSYIGLSVNIEKRWQTHQSRAFSENKEYDKVLYKAFRKYGIENFSFKVLEEVENAQDLPDREIFWISKYNTFHNGYNETPGGEIGNLQHGEHHSMAKLTEKDVIEIRTAYNQRKRKNEIYPLYQDKIGPSGFDKVWKGETWKEIMPEIYTLENREYHRMHTGNPGSKNGKAKLTEEDVYNIRLRRKNGEHCLDVYQDYTFMKKGSFDNVWNGYNWKNVIV